MKHSVKKIFGFAKGLLAGSLLGGAITLFSAPKDRKRFLSGNSPERELLPRTYRPLFVAGSERVVEVKRNNKLSGWFVLLYALSAVVTIVRLIKKKR